VQLNHESTSIIFIISSSTTKSSISLNCRQSQCNVMKFERQLFKTCNKTYSRSNSRITLYCMLSVNKRWLMCYYKKCIHCTGRQSVVINADTIQITQTLSLNLSAILQIYMQFNIADVIRTAKYHIEVVLC